MGVRYGSIVGVCLWKYQDGNLILSVFLRGTLTQVLVRGTLKVVQCLFKTERPKGLLVIMT